MSDCPVGRGMNNLLGIRQPYLRELIQHSQGDPIPGPVVFYTAAGRSPGNTMARHVDDGEGKRLHQNTNRDRKRGKIAR